jgi:hypothetical protein
MFHRFPVIWENKQERFVLARTAHAAIQEGVGQTSFYEHDERNNPYPKTADSAARPDTTEHGNETRNDRFRSLVLSRLLVFDGF